MGLPRCMSTASMSLPASPTRAKGVACKAWLGLASILVFFWYHLDVFTKIRRHGPIDNDDWGTFPRPGDPFHFLPCTNATFPPRLDEPDPLKAWQRLSEPDPSKWSRGKNARTALFLCGWLDVPLDYTNASDDRVARLAITRFQHKPQASARTMVIQPGGPGGSGTYDVRSEGEANSRDFSDSSLDVLGWDPRGVPSSQPSISCFPNDAVRDRWKMSTSLGFRESDPRKSMLKADAMNEAVFHACKQKYGDVAGMLTTAFVARDLEEIRKAMVEDTLSGYFVSYGSLVGQTYINMFPNSAGRLILDGIVYQGIWRKLAGFGTASLGIAKPAFEDGFLGQCVDAGPGHCALARSVKSNGELPTRQDLVNSVESLLSQLSVRPISGYTGKSGPFIITYSSVSLLLAMCLYDPSSWPQVADALYCLRHGNATLMSRLVDNWDYVPDKPQPKLAMAPIEMTLMVFCSDNYDSPLPPTYDIAASGEQWYFNLWERNLNKAEVGGDRAFYLTLPCRQWNATFGAPKEVYRGRLNHTLPNPILLVGGTYDTATALAEARKLSDEMGDNARLIVHHGYGHTSESDPSRCTIEWKRDYLLHGKLPDQKETDCYADQKPYRYRESNCQVSTQGECK